LPPRTIHQKVFEDEPAFSTVKGTPALAAAKLLVREGLVRFDADEFVLRRAVRALERRCFGDWHIFGAVWYPHTISVMRAQQMLAVGP
jgi:hypothetical protein